MRLIKAFFLLNGVIFLLILGCSHQRDENKTNIHKLHQKALRGDEYAQFQLGKIYYYLENDISHYDKAFKWFSESAKYNNSYAKHYLGRMYYYGLFVNKNKIIANEYFISSINKIIKDCKSHKTEATYIIGWCFDNGIIFQKNYANALKWYTLSSEKGHSIAQYNLGLCYILGKGTDKNIEEAKLLLQKSAMLNDPMAQFCLASLYAKKIRFEPTDNYDNNNIPPKESIEFWKWLFKAAENRLPAAQYTLSYYNNYSRVIYNLYESAENGYAPSQFLLGDILTGCKYNKVIEINFTEGISWLRKAANQGYLQAQEKLGKNFFEDKEGKTYQILEQSESIKWLEKAAAQGSYDAQYRLAQFYYNTKDLNEHILLAYKWIHQAMKYRYFEDPDSLREKILQNMTKAQIEKGNMLMLRTIIKKEKEIIGEYPYHFLLLKDLNSR